jgi:hypothetical protein
LKAEDISNLIVPVIGPPEIMSFDALQRGFKKMRPRLDRVFDRVT